MYFRYKELISMAEHPTKPWRCDHGHILGQVFRNGNKVRQLALYRAAVDLEAVDLEQVEVMAVVDGFVADIRCSICGCVRSWVPGEESLRLLMERRKQMWERG
jgi:hypothetical protein